MGEAAEIVSHMDIDVIDINLSGKSQSYSLQYNKDKSLAKYSILETIKTMSWDQVPAILESIAHATQVDIPDTPPDNSKPMTWAMARELEKAGVIFGPHTVTHPILSKVSDKQSQEEISHSWQRLTQELTSPCRVFCYPNGEPYDFGNREIELIKKSQFLGAVSTIPGQVKFRSTNNNYLFSLPRYSLPSSFHDFIMYCSWIEYAKEKIRGY